MLNKIKGFLKIKKRPTNVVIFWNALYYIVLIVSALINWEIGVGIYAFSSIFAMLMICGGVLSPDEAEDLFKGQIWVLTSMPVLFIGFWGGVAFIVIYPIYKLIKWINNLLNGKTCLRHDDKRTSELPSMVNDPNCSSSYEITYTCQKCGRVKETWSDQMGGVRIIE